MTSGPLTPDTVLYAGKEMKAYKFMYIHYLIKKNDLVLTYRNYPSKELSNID